MVELPDNGEDGSAEPILPDKTIDDISYGDNSYTYTTALRGLVDYLRSIQEGDSGAPNHKTPLLQINVPRFRGENEVFSYAIRWGLQTVLRKSDVGIDVLYGKMRQECQEGTPPTFTIRMSAHHDEKSYGPDRRSATYSYQRSIWKFELVEVSTELMGRDTTQEE